MPRVLSSRARPDLSTPHSLVVHQFLRTPRPFMKRAFVPNLDAETVRSYRKLIVALMDGNLISQGQALMLDWFIVNWPRLHPVSRSGYRRLLRKLEHVDKEDALSAIRSR